MIRELGEPYVVKVRKMYAGRVPGSADFVCYWFAKGLRQIASNSGERCGFVSTNSISSGSGRAVLGSIVRQYPIFEAWADEPWVIDGASVRVAITCFGKSPNAPIKLNDTTVAIINSDLTSRNISLSSAKVLKENKNVSFVGVQKNGPFDIPGELARAWLQAPLNPNGRPNSDVLRPAINGGSLVRRNPDRWLIDFGCEMPIATAELYELPFEYVKKHVKPTRDNVRRDWHRKHWWLHGDPRPGFRSAIDSLQNYILTPMISKHRIFSFVDARIMPENKSVAFATDSFVVFGVLHSRFHEAWSLALCTYMGVGNDPSYSPSRCFETFPFPKGLMPLGDWGSSIELHQPIELCARELHKLRLNWLQPADLVKKDAEVVAGYPERLFPFDQTASLVLEKRTLTNLYNAKPAWLQNVHKALDEAVAAAYGWPADISDEEVLSRLFALNCERSLIS